MGRGISQWDKDFEQKTDREKEIALEKRMSHEKTVAIEFIEGMKGFIKSFGGLKPFCYLKVVA